MDSPNIAQTNARVGPEALSLASALLERLGAGDVDLIAQLFSESIDWLVPGDRSLPWTGGRSHRADVAEYFRPLWSPAMSDMTAGAQPATPQ